MPSPVPCSGASPMNGSRRSFATSSALSQRGLYHHRRQPVLDSLSARTPSRGTGSSAKRDRSCRVIVMAIRGDQRKPSAISARLVSGADCAEARRAWRHDFAAGTGLVCSPYVLHRMPALWPAPDEFRPERFLPGQRVAPRSYIPFGSGMRACTGRAMALMELSILVPPNLFAL